MRKERIFSKIFGVALVFAMIGAMLGGLSGTANAAAVSDLGRAPSNVNPSISKTDINSRDLAQNSDVTISNEHLTMEIYPDGNFRGFTATGECIFFPSPTSDMTIKIGSNEYSIGYGTLSNYRTKDTYINPNNDKEAITEWDLPEGIHVEQHIKLEGDHVTFTVNTRNTQSSDQDVSIRYLWDTQLCDNDGSPLKAKGLLYTKEMCFEPVDFDHWSAYSRLDESTAELVTYGWWADTPDRLIFAHWPHAIGTVYSYDWDPNRQFYTPGYVTSPESDSCVLMYWENINVPASGEKSVTSFYGTSIQTGLTLSMRLDKTEYNPNEMMNIYVRVIDTDGNSNYPLTRDNTEVKIDGNDVEIEDITIQSSSPTFLWYEYVLKVKAPSEGGSHTIWVQVVTDQGYASAEETFTVERTPVLLVHGYFPFAYETMVLILEFDGYKRGETLFELDFESLSYPSGIIGYASKLSDTVKEIKQMCDVNKVDIIAHGMGGLVARWYIEKDNGAEDVRKLIMLGTPNRGSVYFLEVRRLHEVALKLVEYMIMMSGGVPIGIVVRPVPERQMMSGSVFIKDLNSHPTYTDVSTNYFTIAGNKSPWFMDWIFFLHPPRENDGLIRTAEVKLEGIQLEIYPEDHFRLCVNNEILWHIADILGDDPNQQISTTSMQAQWQGMLIQAAPMIFSKIFPGQQKSHEIPISATTEVAFTLTWVEGDLDLTLATPSGTLIDPSVAESHPNITYYQDLNITTEQYVVKYPEPGTWKANATAVDVPEQGEDYVVMTFLETPITLSLDLPKYRYDPAENIPIKAELKSDDTPITGASVTAKINRPDDSAENITLYDDGLHNDEAANDGIYANIYTDTSSWGAYDMAVTASGTIDSEEFAREVFATIWVEQYPDLALSESDIHLSNNSPEPGEVVTINATTHNIGSADANNASILFYAGDPASGTLIGEDIITVEAGNAAEASIEWTAVEGVKEICVLVSPYNEFLEEDYTNNRACAEIIYPDMWIDILTTEETPGVEQHTGVIETLADEPCDLTVYVKNTGNEILHNVQILTNVGVTEDVGDIDEAEIRQVPIEFTPTTPGLSGLNVTVRSDEIERSLARALLVEKFDFSVSILKTKYSLGEPVPIDISVTNEVPGMRFLDLKIEISISGSYEQTFEIPLLSLAPLETKDTTFTWDTTGISSGSYTIATSLLMANQEVLSDIKIISLATALITDLPNVKLVSADPTVTQVSVSSLDLSEIDETYKPEEVIAKYVYLVDAMGEGNFVLEFTDIAGANAIKVYKIDPTTTPPNQWIELDYTTTASTVTFTMSVGDPPVVFGEVSGENNPPYEPSDPFPSNHATNVSIDADLSWSGGDPDAEDMATYDVYFGTDLTPPLMETIGPYAASQISMSYDPGLLSDDTKYYWQIVAMDDHGIVKEGPVWDFTTPSACFIATAAYGTPTAEELDILREFRDEVLLPDKMGAAFVSFYYHVSPPIADFISQHKVLKTIVREGFIDPLVAIVKYGQLK